MTSKPIFETTETAPSGKWWGHSLTVWGTLITALATVLPALGPLIGLDISGEMVHQAGASLAAAAQAIVGLIGTLMAIYGRVRASQPLTRRAVSLRL